MVPGLFRSGKVALKLFLDPIFSNMLSSQYLFFYSRIVTREVKVESEIFKVAEPEETR